MARAGYGEELTVIADLSQVLPPGEDQLMAGAGYGEEPTVIADLSQVLPPGENQLMAGAAGNGEELFLAVRVVLHGQGCVGGTQLTAVGTVPIKRKVRTLTC